MYMRKILVFLSILSGLFSFSQKIQTQTIFSDSISIRAIEIWNDKLWYTGTDAKFGYISLNDTTDKKQLILSDKKLQFRTLAQNKEYFYTINIESPAYFFRIDKKTLQSEIVFTDNHPKAFYDALTFNNKKGIALGDPYGNCMTLLTTNNNGDNWQNIPCYPVHELGKNEAAFAASNTNIYLNNDVFWYVTGGMSSNIFHVIDNDSIIKKQPIKFVNGSPSSGIYSLDMCPDNKFGIVVGGDYTKQSENINNIATSIDGGKTWQVQASGNNAGYTTCVKIRPDTKGKDIIAVGDQHISLSTDYGKNWTKIADEKNLYVCEWVDGNKIVFAGKNRILKVHIQL